MVLRKGLTRMHISFDPIAGRFPAVAAGLAALEQAMDQEMPRWAQKIFGPPTERSSAAQAGAFAFGLRLGGQAEAAAAAPPVDGEGREVAVCSGALLGSRRAPRYCRNIGLE